MSACSCGRRAVLSVRAGKNRLACAGAFDHWRFDRMPCLLSRGRSLPGACGPGRCALVKVQAADVQSGGSMTGMELLSALKKEDQETGFRQTKHGAADRRGRIRGTSAFFQTAGDFHCCENSACFLLLQPRSGKIPHGGAACACMVAVREQEKRPLRGRGLW